MEKIVCLTARKMEVCCVLMPGSLAGAHRIMLPLRVDLPTLISGVQKPLSQTQTEAGLLVECKSCQVENQD